MIVHLIDGTYELFRQFYGIRRGGDRSSFRRGRGRASHRRADARGRSDAHRGRDGSRHRVLPQRSVARVQDRRGNRAGPVGAVPSARGDARRHGCRRLADGRARGRRRPRVRGGHSRPATDASKKSASGLRTRTSRNASWATASSRIEGERRDPQRRRRLREVRRRAGIHPGLSRAGRRRRGRLSRHPRLRPEDGGAPDRTLRTDRRLSARRPRRSARRGAALQAARDAPNRCAALHDVDALRWRGPTAASPPRPRLSATHASRRASKRSRAGSRGTVPESLPTDTATSSLRSARGAALPAPGLPSSTRHDHSHLPASFDLPEPGPRTTSTGYRPWLL